MDENQDAVIRLSVSAPSPNPVHPKIQSSVRPASTSFILEISKAGIIIPERCVHPDAKMERVKE